LYLIIVFNVLFFFICCDIVCFFFFFFQAEDGIRDLIVTGVQTCALPILPCASIIRSCNCPRRATSRANTTRARASSASSTWTTRSEERRVGKECRSRWSPYQ